jgi:hypothetical protein
VFSVLYSAVEAGPAGGTRVHSGLVKEGGGVVIVAIVVAVPVKSTCVYRVLHCSSDRFHVWFPLPGVGWSFPSQVEGWVASSCVGLL